jgi:putative tricarboxylic transport membrane protein
MLLIMLPAALLAAFPSKPIKVIVHTKPGGAVDLMARQVAQVASKYCDQPLVVVNKSGGSGLLAMARVAGEKADGYTLLAYAAAFVPTLQTTDIGFGFEEFYPLACMTISPEALITNVHSDQRDFSQVIQYALDNPGEQKWCGPGSGSLDHLMAVKTMHLAGIEAKWIPYGGGGPAVAAVMGQHADVYIGNPEDLLGREENLHLAAISSTDRLARYPDTPTLSELGIDLTAEVMWRGFAVRASTDPEIIDWYVDLLSRISIDEDWLRFVERTGVVAVFKPHAEFKKLIRENAESSREYLEMAGFKVGTKPEHAPYAALIFSVIFAAGTVLILLLLKIGQRKSNGTIWISLFCVAVAMAAYYMSCWFPDPRAGTYVGAATVPRVWSILLLVLSVFQLGLILRPGADIKTVENGFVSRVWKVVGLLIIFSILVPLSGFFPAGGVLLLGGIYILEYRKHFHALILTVSVLLAMYLIFIQVLSVPLPMGRWG